MTAVKHAGVIAAQMTDEVVASFRTALEEQRAFRLEQLDELMAPASDNPSTVLDPARDEDIDALRTGATVD